MSTSKESVVDVKVAQLKTASWNRGDYGDVEMRELIESVKVYGVMVPLIVRGTEGGYEIVAGHRRAAAARAMELDSVPCVVRAMSDDEAKVINVIENLQRKNLNPIEEAKAFNTLSQDGAVTLAAVAYMVSKPLKYVYRARELLTLPKDAIEAIESGVLTAAHGHQLARLTEPHLTRLTAYALMPYHGQYPSVEDLKSQIARTVEKDLAAAPFDKKQPYAGLIACVVCPSNTKNQSMLFDQAESGHCTDGVCFAKKLTQFYTDLRAVGEKKWPALKFIGAGTAGYGPQTTIKDYMVVEEKDPKVRDAIKHDRDDEKPEFIKGYGFGIIKPSNWSTTKTPKLVLLKKQVNSAKAEASRERYRGPTDEEQAEQEYRLRFSRAHLAAVLFPATKLDGPLLIEVIEQMLQDQWRADKIVPFLKAAGVTIKAKETTREDVLKQLKGFGNAMLFRLAFWALPGINDGMLEEIVAKHGKVKIGAEMKKAEKLSADAWKKDKDVLIEEWKARHADRS